MLWPPHGERRRPPAFDNEDLDFEEDEDKDDFYDDEDEDQTTAANHDGGSGNGTPARHTSKRKGTTADTGPPSDNEDGFSDRLRRWGIDDDELQKALRESRGRSGQSSAENGGVGTSDFQANASQTRNGTFVPDWAEVITPDFAERCALGKIDYWLGLDRQGKVRARGNYLHTDSEGDKWYVVTCRQFAKTIRARDKQQAWRILDRLRRKGFVIADQVHNAYGAKALGLRLNWKNIEAAYVGATADDNNFDE